jgi:hypothetical protein
MAREIQDKNKMGLSYILGMGLLGQGVQEAMGLVGNKSQLAKGQRIERGPGGVTKREEKAFFPRTHSRAINQHRDGSQAEGIEISIPRIEICKLAEGVRKP